MSSPRLSLSPSRNIPFNKLKLSQANVRRINVGISIDELAEDIARRGLLQSLNVRPILDDERNETGAYEVPAGGRRFRALKLLVKQKRFSKTGPVPCIVRDADTDILAEDDSLAENVQRVALHPLDQYRAFMALREKGQTEEAIAASFFLPVTVVRQRLKLASVSPALLEAYAQDGMTLEQLMAFTLTGDHVRQEQVWEALQHSYSKEPYQIRRMLTEKQVRASDKRARLIGVEAYEAAGGTMSRDLFQNDDGGWLDDPALLDRLVMEKLKTEAETIAAEGWRWIEVAIELPYGHTHGLRRVDGHAAALNDDEQKQFAEVQTEYDELSTEYQDAEELPEEVDARLGELEALIASFEERPVVFDPVEVACAGAFISLRPDGKLAVERGYVRAEDERMADEPEDGDGDTDAITDRDGSTDVAGGSGRGGAVITVAGGKDSAEEDEDDAIRPLPDRLVLELTAHRTLALRDAVAQHPEVALTLLLHKLVTDTFQRGGGNGCLEASIHHVFFPAQAPDLKNSPSACSIAVRQDGWRIEMAPVVEDKHPDALWNWLHQLDGASRLALLAHCVSYGVNALQEKVDRYGGTGVSAHGLSQRLVEANRLAMAVNLDMVEAGWRPTEANYLSRVTKPRILEAVREGAGEQKAELIAHLKKGDMAREAERLLAETGWLPEPLRMSGEDASVANSVSVVADGTEPSSTLATDDLPAFLNDEAADRNNTDADMSDESVSDHPMPSAIAAE
ncbi:MAG: ParB/RepB/Spo0J family partition protein [Bosea sp. (in: a-proteobacteria)]